MTASPQPLYEQSRQIRQLVEATRQDCQDDLAALLSLLRVLEELHRETLEEHFLPKLPSNRQALHALLREMESEGGWPYIPRMRLRELVKHLEAIAQTSLEELAADATAIDEPSLDEPNDHG